MLIVTIDGDKRIIQGFEEAVRRIGSPRPAFERIGTVLVGEFKKNFPAEGARLNEPWKELAASTLREKRRLGFGSQPILVRTGKLRRGFRKQINNTRLRVSNPVPYFKYHQLGSPQTRLPRRRMILFPERLKQEVIAVFTEFITDSFLSFRKPTKRF